MAKTIDDIRGRCVLIDGHWLWKGALSEGWPRIAAPEFTKHEGRQISQHGRRAVWHILNRKAIPKGYRVWGTCSERTCLNPEHIALETTAERGRKVAKSGKLKGDLARIATVRKSARRRSGLTPELIDTIRMSPKTGRALTQELGLSRTVISKVRTGKTTAFTPVGGLFSGLMARAGAAA